jgi:hypothetical protein
MRKRVSLAVCSAVLALLTLSPHAMAQQKTAKACQAEWRANKAANQANGITEKAYVTQCRGSETPTQPTAAPATPGAPSAPAPTTAATRLRPTKTVAGQKTAKDCREEWRGNKAANQANGITEKAYVDQCRIGNAPSQPTAAPAAPPAAPPPKPTASAPRVPPTPTATAQKTAKACRDEWRANKAANQASGVTERAFVDQCRGGGASTQPTAAPAAPPAPAPTTTAAPAAPAPTPTAAAPPAARPSPPPTSTARPAPSTPASPPAGASGFSTEAQAKARCPSDTVVWASLPSKVYHFTGTRYYGNTKNGAYMCESDTAAAGMRAAKNETHP